ncbi:putative calcium activated chlorine channel [Ixodes scapularis]
MGILPPSPSSSPIPQNFNLLFPRRGGEEKSVVHGSDPRRNLFRGPTLRKGIRAGGEGRGSDGGFDCVETREHGSKLTTVHWGGTNSQLFDLNHGGSIAA